jgi:hypothetical protein
MCGNLLFHFDILSVPHCRGKAHNKSWRKYSKKNVAIGSENKINRQPRGAGYPFLVLHQYMLIIWHAGYHLRDNQMNGMVYTII